MSDPVWADMGEMVAEVILGAASEPECAWQDSETVWLSAPPTMYDFGPSSISLLWRDGESFNGIRTPNGQRILELKATRRGLLVRTAGRVYRLRRGKLRLHRRMD